MIIIRNNSSCPHSIHKDLEHYIRKQADTGLIVLPDYCELLHIDRKYNEIVITNSEIENTDGK